MAIVKRVLVWGVVVVAVPVALAILGTLIPYPDVYASVSQSMPGKRILVVANTIHTDIAIPADPQTLAALGFLADTGLPIAHPDAQWLLIGWGGRSFYLETPTLADIRPGPTFRALTIDSSVMHVDVLAQVDETAPGILAMPVSDDAYANLLTTISASFSRTDGHVVPIEGYSFGAVDKFYEAEGSFNALLGCNVWASRVLRSAGIRTGLWNPLPNSLVASLRLFNEE